MHKTIFMLIYWGAGAVVSYFLPENARFTFGFILAVIAAWAHKIITDKEVNHG